jgi:hypothetical protein
MTLQELVEATAQGRLRDLLSERGAEVTPELAGEARELFKQALGGGNLGLASVAAAAAAQAWMHLGNRREALVNHVDTVQMEFMAAETPEAYAQARNGLLEAKSMADDIGAGDQAFKALTIAADCSYFAAQASTPQAKEDLLLQALEDVVAAGAFAYPGAEGDLERYVSLLAATAHEAMTTFWTDDRAGRADELLRRLAKAADETVPVDFSYSQVGDPEKTAQTARVLASLTDEYGS